MFELNQTLLDPNQALSIPPELWPGMRTLASQGFTVEETERLAEHAAYLARITAMSRTEAFEKVVREATRIRAHETSPERKAAAARGQRINERAGQLTKKQP